MPSAFDILYEDGPCLVVSKPGGLLTQAPPGIDSLEQRIKEYLRGRDPEGPPPYLGVPHRLDRPASGAMVFATRVKAARRLARQFENRTVKKTYWAFVQGDVQPKAGAWRDHLRKVPEVARAEIVSAAETGARQAVLHYEVCWRNPQGSLLRIKLETGRMHQIRLQAASRGHPIWGDRQYGSPFAFGPPEEDCRLRWIALHAQRIEFEHTVSRQLVSVTAPLPDIWASVGVPRLES